jgi:uncharacterized membrane protein YcaP (DUF421 family)
MPLMLAKTLQDMFVLNLPLLEKVARPIVVYFALVVLLRIFGKRELAQLNPFDLVVLLSVSNTVQNAIIGDDNSVTGGLLGALSLFAINYGVVRFLFRHRRLDQVLEGSPTTLISGGKVVREGLCKELLTESELAAVAHKQGFDSIGEIESCVLEPGGNFFIKGRTPPVEDTRHAELLGVLSEIRDRVAKLESLSVSETTAADNASRSPR